MGLLSAITGGALQPIADGVEAVSGTIERVKKNELDAKQAMAELEQKLPELQAQINLAEASNASMFVSGWRPALGWVCATGLAYDFVFRPIFNGFFDSTRFVPLDVQTILGLVIAMLGVAGYRTAEKIKGVARD